MAYNGNKGTEPREWNQVKELRERNEPDQLLKQNVVRFLRVPVLDEYVVSGLPL